MRHNPESGTPPDLAMLGPLVSPLRQSSWTAGELSIYSSLQRGESESLATFVPFVSFGAWASSVAPKECWRNCRELGEEVGNA